MSYDDETGTAAPPSLPSIEPLDSRDLDLIVTLLELAAIDLTKERGMTFTRDELIRTAREIGGPEIGLLDVDIAIVLPGIRFIRRVGKRLVVV